MVGLIYGVTTHHHVRDGLSPIEFVKETRKACELMNPGAAEDQNRNLMNSEKRVRSTLSLPWFAARFQ